MSSIKLSLDASASPQDTPADVPVLGASTVAVPGAEGATVQLTVHADQSIWIERPAAWAGGIRMPAERYQWQGGIPSPDKPKAPHGGPYEHEDLAWREPILAVLKAHSPSGKEPADLKKAAKQLWDLMWAEVAPHLNARAARLASAYEYHANLYQVLTGRPDLCDHLEVCPALGPFLTLEAAQAIPATGWSLAQVASRLITPAGTATPAELSPGFMAWARRLTWNPKVLPQFSKGDKRIPAIRGFVRQAVRVGPQLDPNGIQKLREDAEWLLLNLALASPGTSFAAPAILRNPQSALKATERYFPREMSEAMDTRERMEKVLAALMEWHQHDDEGLAEQVTGFNRLVEEAKSWNIAMMRTEYDANQRFAAWRAARQAERDLAAAQAAERARRLAEEAAARGAYWRLAGDIDPDEPFPNAPPVREYQDDKYRIEYLPDGRRLQEESTFMNHCVVTHAPNCVRGTEFVFSVRAVDEPDLPIATIALNSNGHVKEARGPANAALSTELDAWTRGMAKAMFCGELEAREYPKRAPKTRPEDDAAARAAREAGDTLLALTPDRLQQQVAAAYANLPAVPTTPRPRGARKPQ